MTETKERRKRKPKDLHFEEGPIYCAGIDMARFPIKNEAAVMYIVKREEYGDDAYLSPNQARRLAKWLNDASDYLEARKK